MFLLCVFTSILVVLVLYFVRNWENPPTDLANCDAGSCSKVSRLCPLYHYAQGDDCILRQCHGFQILTEDGNCIEVASTFEPKGAQCP